MLALAFVALSGVAPAPASPIPAQSRQLLLVTAATWDSPAGVARLYERDAARHAWRALGRPMPVSLGRAGLAWGRGLHVAPAGAEPTKREGDGRSPAGVFDLRRLTGYAAQPPRGARLPYEVATATLRCIDDPASRHYNRLVDEARVTRDWNSAEDMRRGDDLYRLVAWVGHNDAPVEAHAGSCIFLHLRAGSGSVTAGCTAFDAGDLEHLLQRLDPRERPVLVQLPEERRRALSATWGLPATHP